MAGEVLAGSVSHPEKPVTRPHAGPDTDPSMSGPYMRSPGIHSAVVPRLTDKMQQGPGRGHVERMGAQG